MTRLFSFGSLAFVIACGGTAVVETSGGSGGTSASGGGGGGGGATTGGAGGLSGCMAHGQCPDGSLCVFETGECILACADVCDSCGPGFICEPCATSTCPGCKDCASGCLPAAPGRCDDDDPCLDGAEVCAYGPKQCVPGCGPGGDCGGSLACSACAASSCCGCDDCVPACVPI